MRGYNCDLVLLVMTSSWEPPPFAKSGRLESTHVIRIKCSALTLPVYGLRDNDRQSLHLVSQARLLHQKKKKPLPQVTESAEVFGHRQ